VGAEAAERRFGWIGTTRWGTLPADRMRPRAHTESTAWTDRDDPGTPGGAGMRLRSAPVSTPLRERLGPLSERPFRLLFSATTISTFGDAIEHIALAFAVLALPGASAGDLGFVLATRTVLNTVVVVAGGVISDRVPRNVVLVGSSLLQGTSQAVTAGLLLTDSASIGSLIVLAGVYGAGNGLVIPAEVGLVPQSVSDARLQQANALQGLSRNFVGVLGPALGEVFVVAGSPGIALALDSVTFFVAAALFATFRIPGRVQREREGERSSTSCARAGREFTPIPGCGPPSFSFGVSNFVFIGCWAVLGPVVAKEELGGAGAWATVRPAWGICAVVGGLAALRYRPKRPLLASVIVSWPILLQLLGPRPLRSCLASRRRVVPLRRGDRDAPRALVHGFPSRGACARTVPRQLLRRVRLSRPHPARDGRSWSHRGPDRVAADVVGAFTVALVCLVATALVPSVRAIRAADEELVSAT
jgi:transmembrane secretion effector